MGMWLRRRNCETNSADGKQAQKMLAAVRLRKLNMTHQLRVRAVGSPRIVPLLTLPAYLLVCAKVSSNRIPPFHHLENLHGLRPSFCLGWHCHGLKSNEVFFLLKYMR